MLFTPGEVNECIPLNFTLLLESQLYGHHAGLRLKLEVHVFFAATGFLLVEILWTQC